MLQIKQTDTFKNWFDAMRDRNGRTRIAQRLSRLRDGHFGDAKPVGQGVVELRIRAGPGYRVYLTKQGDTIVILLCGGDKGTQKRDIVKAKLLAKEVLNGQNNADGV